MTAHPAPPFNSWLSWQAWSETWAAGLDPLGTGARQRERRLTRLIEQTLRGSPFYRRRQRGRDAVALSDFAPVGKAELMDHFDDWATDRRVTRASAAAFIADEGCVADGWLGDYLLWSSSGTSGVPGWFVQDAQSLAAYDAIDALRLCSSRSGMARPGLGAWGLGRRFAYVGATGGHFAGLASIERLRRLAPPLLAPTIDVLSVQQPLARLAAELQALQPEVLITYPSCAAALAQWQGEGTLQLRLREVWLGGEQLSAEQRRRVQTAFGATVRNNYGASEFFSIAAECDHGCLHVNDDWVILEPVDEHLRALPAGVLSHTTLLTNLANLTQPLLRYQLGDRVRVHAERCPCGSAFTAIDVQGRSDDTVTLHDAQRRAVPLLPLALETVIEEDAGVTQFQLIERSAGRLELRFEPAVPDREAAFVRCRRALLAHLRKNGVVRTQVAYSADPPLHEGASGKLRRVISAPGRH